MTASRTVPIANETNAAWKVPTDLPRWELIGAWSAIAPPHAAVSATASPLRSISRPLLGLEPGLADADVHGQRRLAVAPRREHLALHQRLDRVRLLGRALEEQLVVDGEDEPGPQVLVVERAGRADHRQLQDVCRRALDRRVDGKAFARRAHAPVARLELGDVAPAPVERRRVAGLGRLLDLALDVLGVLGGR